MYHDFVIERIYVENYKCLVDFDLHLQDTTLLFGANGAGKTAVLDVVYGLRKLLAGEVKITDSVAFPSSTLTRWQTRNHQHVAVQVRAGGETFSYDLRVEHNLDVGLSRVTHERLTGEDSTLLFNCELGELRLFRDDGSEGPVYGVDWTESALARVQPHSTNKRLTAFLDAVRGIVVSTIRPYGIRSESTQEDRLLDRYAANFVDWYRHALQENPRLARSHVKALRPVIDNFSDLHLTRAGLDTRALMISFDTDAGGMGNSDLSYQLRFGELSDGQRALVILYGLLHLVDSGEGIWLFLDEPDNYVALPEIQPWLMTLVELCDETPSQAVICSHHPEMIDYLGADCGRVLRRNASGASTPYPVVSQASPEGLKLSELMARGWDT